VLARDGRSRLALECSAGFEAGMIAASPDPTILGGRAQTRPWLAPVASGRVHFAPFRRVSIQIYAGASLALVRDQFRLVMPARVAYEAAAVAGFSGLGLSVRLD
jgi:hypothetical protein